MRRNEQRVLGSVFLNIVADLLGIELGNDYDLKAERQRHVQARNDAVGRKHRDDVHKALAALVGNAAVPEIKRDRIEAVVREHNALGCAGRSAGERNCGKIILAVFHGLGLNANAGSGKLRPCQHLIARRDLRSRHFELL